MALSATNFDVRHKLTANAVQLRNVHTALTCREPSLDLRYVLSRQFFPVAPGGTGVRVLLWHPDDDVRRIAAQAVRAPA